MAETTHIPSSIWSPEDPSYGFTVQLLPEAPQPVPISAAFAHKSEIFEGVSNRVQHRDKVRMVTPHDTLSPKEVLLDVKAFVPVLQDKFDAIRTQGIEVRPGHFPEEEEEAFAQGLRHAIHRKFAPEWGDLPSGLVERQEKLSQVITFESGGKSIDLYNFSPSRLEEEQVAKVANTVREMSDRTGGAVFDMLSVMAIVPSDDPEVAEKNEGGEYEAISLGTAWSNSIVLSEYLFNPAVLPPKVTAPIHNELYGMIDADNPFLVEGDQLQLTVFHELTHIVSGRGRRDRTQDVLFGANVGWERDLISKQPLKRGYVENPFVYGRDSETEDVAVTAEAQFKGGEEWSRFDPHRQLGVRALWANCHSQVQGPTFVTARELPLPQSPNNKIGMQPEVPIAIKPNYTYTPYKVSVYEEIEALFT